ncbi:MAG: B12-binding domain-containing radical SAM protein [Planctomycetes bacterium]|nr:B12-binding domain-containing radical SAM protein [Planctomycetota bacterium]
MSFSYNKLLLINSGEESIFASNEPLNLALLASFLQSKGVDVIIADQLSGESIIEKYNYFNPDIIGLTATTPLVKDAYSISTYFKKKNIPTILGGVHATTFPEEALTKVDMVIKGEGEYALLDILLNGKEKGIYSSDNVVNINDMPLPARSLLNNKYYLNVRRKFPQDGNYNFVPWNERLLSVMISRGCHWNCTFCHNVWRGSGFRIYSPYKVLEELQVMKDSYGLDYFIFRDDNIYSNRKKAKEILLAVIDANLNLKWGANARVDCLDDEILELSKKAGCLKLNFGFESGSQTMLNELNKKARVEKAYEAVALCKKHKIQASGSFIVGHPNEESSDINATRRMIRKLKLDSIGVAIATPFPGTRWWKTAEERGLIPSNIDWGKFDFDHVPIKLNESFSTKELKVIQKTYYYDAIKTNPKYLAKLMFSMILNPYTLKKRIVNVLGIA